MNRPLIWSAVTLALASACAKTNPIGASTSEDVSSMTEPLHMTHGGAVFTESNESAGNRVIAFMRDDDGELTASGAVATQGLGSGDSLGSQGALALSEDHRFLLVVNAGSNDVSSFAVDGAALTLVDRVASGGTRPISVTTRRGLAYVLNAGTPANVTGFFLSPRGMFQPIAGGTRGLSGDAVGPAQVELTPDARALVVTEKATSLIDTFRVSVFGRLDAPIAQASAGTTPFGFEFTRSGDLIVSEAATASMSSYDVSPRSGVNLISGPIPDTQAAPCWVAISHDDRFAYTANAGSASISSYTVDGSGAIALLFARAGELATGAKPLDMALDTHGKYLYALDRGNTAIASFTVQHDGSLDPLDAVDGLTSFTTGLAAY
jgi:6-phosphogluconolactonase (cycloisomerase 2 family)